MPATRYRSGAVVVADKAPGSSLRQEIDARSLTEVIEAVVLAAERDLFLEYRDGRLIFGIDDLDGR